MDKILSGELLLSASAACPPESALLGDYRDSFCVGDKIKVGDDHTLCVVVSVSEKELVIKRYSDFIRQEKLAEKKSRKRKHKIETQYYRKFVARYGT